MGDHNINTTVDAAIRSRFTQNLLTDIKALEWMLEKKLFETNVTRIGAEQEFCLINKNWRPSKNSLAVLDSLNDHHFTTELARYNLEINLEPQIQCHDCLSKLEKQLNSYLQKAETASKTFGDKVLLTGILPTINKNELELEYMTPGPRYKMINELFRQLRGADFEFRITGVDELLLRHESVLLEACNTSFQMHLQIDANDFISGYNWAQAIAGPVLSICTNSPLLFGRELWSETRIALFQQSTDTRNSSYALKDQQARATFGRTWAKGSAAEIFKDDLAQHKIMLTREIENDSLKTLMEGRIPGLAALILHNSTVYRWNRPCYGVLDGKPHLRIENRYIPSGPTIADEIANFAFWLGLMLGRPPRYDDMPQCMDFRDAKSNFIKAARTGKESVLCWDGNLISAPDLILTVLLPIAYDGLTKAGIQGDDIDRFLGIIENRTRGTDGSQWMIQNYRTLRRSLKIDDALMALTKAVYEYQRCNHLFTNGQCWNQHPIPTNMHSWFITLCPHNYLQSTKMIRPSSPPV